MNEIQCMFGEQREVQTNWVRVSKQRETSEEMQVRQRMPARSPCYAIFPAKTSHVLAEGILLLCGVQIILILQIFVVPVRKAVIQKSIRNKCWRRCGEIKNQAYFQNLHRSQEEKLISDQYTGRLGIGLENSH